MTTATAVLTKKHPSGLPMLFLTEMWERFGFYTLQALLILYFTNSFGFSDAKSYRINGAFMAFVYLSPLIGGYIADKILGFRRTIIIGAVFLALGYGLMAVPKESVMYWALAIIVIGNGFFKPNISSLLGTLYGDDKAHRDAGFTIFYMGVNVGVILAGICSGFLQKYIGWGPTFMAASIGLVIGLVTFTLGLRTLRGHGILPPITYSKKWMQYLHSPWFLAISILPSIVLINFLLRSMNLTNWLLTLFAAVSLIIFMLIAARQRHKLARNRMFALIILIISSVVFWGLFFQVFMSVNLFIDRLVDRQVFGFELPTPIYVSLESFFIVVLGPFMARLWHRLQACNNNPSIPTKFALATFIISFAFFMLALASYLLNPGVLVNSLWIVWAYFLITVGELLLSPIGLSAVTMLAPAEYVGLMMGGWFLALGFGGKFAGVIANMASIPEGLQNKMLENHYYTMAFFKFACMAFFVGLLITLIIKPVKKLISAGAHIQDPVQ